MLDLNWLDELHDDDPVTITFAARELKELRDIAKAAARYLATGNGAAGWGDLRRALKDTPWLDEAEGRLRRG